MITVIFTVQQNKLLLSLLLLLLLQALYMQYRLSDKFKSIDVRHPAPVGLLHLR